MHSRYGSSPTEAVKPLECKVEDSYDAKQSVKCNVLSGAQRLLVGAGGGRPAGGRCIPAPAFPGESLRPGRLSQMPVAKREFRAQYYVLG